MALSTTQSIWRSGGGDNTRTAYCGSTLMAAQFYIANMATASNTRMKVSSAAGAADLILPAGAVVTSIAITAETGSGQLDVGVTGYTSGTSSSAYIADQVGIAVGTTSIGTVVFGNALTEMSYVTATDSTGGMSSGSVTGIILYFVTDPLTGQQNV